MLGGSELKPGHYSLEMDGTKVIVRNGKLHGEAPAKMEEGDSKYNRTSVVLERAGSQMRVQEIHIGGTNMKVVFAE
jgi:hypothetical protein